MNQMQPTQHEHTAGAAGPAIDEGMRRWYESCPCCLSAAYPAVRRALDDEKDAKHATESQDAA